MVIIRIGSTEIKLSDDQYAWSIATQLFEAVSVALNQDELPVEVKYVNEEL